MTPVSFLENRLRFRKDVLDFSFAVLAVDVLLHHAHGERSGSVERVESGEILELARFRTPQKVLHAPRFELEDAVGTTFAEESEDRLVLKRHLIQIERVALGVRGSSTCRR